MEKIMPGVQLKSFINDSPITMTVTRTEEIDRGILFQVSVEGYGEPGPFFQSNEQMLDSDIAGRRGRSGMPSEFMSKQAKDFRWNEYGEEVSALKQICNGFVVNYPKFSVQGRGLYIFSETKGSGKTLLACVLANEVLKRIDMSVKFISTADLLALDMRSDEGRNTFGALTNCSLLILDDVGMTVEKRDWASSIIYRLIDYRYKEHLPTIYTSNLRIDDLGCDDRVRSRIEAVSVPVKMPEVNVRKRYAEKYTQDFLKSVFSANAEETERIF